MKKTCTIAAALLLAAASLASARSIFEQRADLVGTVLDHPAPSIGFVLTDQNSQDFYWKITRGKVVVVTFISTHCTDICPFVSLKVKEVRRILGSEADKAVFVAITTDPERDTPQVIADYSRTAGLSDGWHFLTGPRLSLKRVWAAYGIGVQVQKSAGAAAKETRGADIREPAQGLSPADLELAGRIIDMFGGGYEVSHSTPYWIVDRAGNVRVAMDAEAVPGDIAKNIRALIRGR